METTARRRLVETYGLDPVPLDEKNTKWYEYLFMQMAVSVNAGNFLIPALAVAEGGLSFSAAIIATVSGAVLAFIFVSLLSFPGSRAGIPSQYALRAILGVKWSKYLASPVRTLTSLYWFAVQAVTGGLFLKSVIAASTGYAPPLAVLTLPLALIMTLLALIGYEAVKKVLQSGLPVLLLAGIVMLTILISHHSGPIFTSGTGTFSLGTAFFYGSLAFVQYVSGVSSASDLTRYAKTPKQGAAGLFFGNTAGFLLTALLGASAAALTGGLNPFLSSMAAAANPLIHVIIAAGACLSMIMININNAYTGGYSLLNTFSSLSRLKSAIVFSVAALILTAVGEPVTQAGTFVSWLGCLIIPLSSIIVFDFIFVKKFKITLEATIRKENRAAFITAAAGLIMYWCIPQSLSPGFMDFLLTGALYLLINCRKLKSR